jgi:purine nucleoside phosphorylase
MPCSLVKVLGVERIAMTNKVGAIDLTELTVRSITMVHSQIMA